MQDEILKHHDMKTQNPPNLSLKLRPDLKQWLKIYCATNEISMTEVITELIEKFKTTTK